MRDNGTFYRPDFLYPRRNASITVRIAPRAEACRRRGSDQRLVLNLAHLFAIQWEQRMCLRPVCYIYAQRLPMVGGSTKMNTGKHPGILDLVSCRGDA